MAEWPVLNHVRRHGAIGHSSGDMFRLPNPLGDIQPVHLGEVASSFFSVASEKMTVPKFPASPSPFERAWFEFSCIPLGGHCAVLQNPMPVEMMLEAPGSEMSVGPLSGFGTQEQIRSLRSAVTSPPGSWAYWWMVFFLPFHEVGRIAALPIGLIDMFIRKDTYEPISRIADSPLTMVAVETAQSAGVPYSKTAAKLAMLAMIEVVRFCWALMTCKNCELREVHPSTRKDKHKTDPARVIYRELVIKEPPVRRITNSAPREDTRGTALHIVRGHFKEYDEKPLFGRIKGRWFWPAHVAGDVNYGTVLKSYVMDKPGEGNNGKPQ